MTSLVCINCYIWISQLSLPLRRRTRLYAFHFPSHTLQNTKIYKLVCARAWSIDLYYLQWLITLVATANYTIYSLHNCLREDNSYELAHSKNILFYEMTAVNSLLIKCRTHHHSAWTILSQTSVSIKHCLQQTLTNKHTWRWDVDSYRKKKGEEDSSKDEYISYH